MNDKKINLPKEYMGNGNKRKFAPSEMLKRKAVAEVERATLLAGLKDRDVAEKLGISRQTYSRMKSVKSALNMGNIEAIAEALGCEVEIKFVKKGE